MLNLYAVKVWHSSEPRHAEMIEVRTYTARRAEHLASESYPGCEASAQPIYRRDLRSTMSRLRSANTP